MPNPYDDIFGDQEPSKKREQEAPETFGLFDKDFTDPGKEPLDEILESIKTFNEKAEAFTRLLSNTKAIDDKVENEIIQLFIAGPNKHKKENLAAEKHYHQILKKKFTGIIEPMRELAEIHLATVRQFNRDIDQHYYSIDKEDSEVKFDKANAVDGINLQRSILANAAKDLSILEEALARNEKRIKKYIDAGGSNNISAAEYELMKRKRRSLTDGIDHRFNFSLFSINVVDKTAISLGVYLKETTAQYLQKLGEALNI